MIRGVLLDIDGTLIDSNDAHAESWVKVFKDHGFDVKYDEVRRTIGMGGDKMVEKFAGVAKESPLGTQLSTERTALFKKSYLPKLKPFAKVRDLIKLLISRGLVLIVATSASRSELQGLLKQAGLDDLLTQATSSDDAERSKPDPDIVQAALEKARLKPEEAIMIGDTPYDIEAAARAGVRSIAVMCGGWKAEDLSGATEIYKDAADLMTNLERSILLQPR